MGKLYYTLAIFSTNNIYFSDFLLISFFWFGAKTIFWFCDFLFIWIAISYVKRSGVDQPIVPFLASSSNDEYMPPN